MIELEEKLTNEESEKLMRLKAEFANFKKRTEMQREEEKKMAGEEVILNLLPICDDLKRAIENMPSDTQHDDWCEGIALIEQSLHSVLNKEGLEKIDACGCEFDPHKHEAVAIQEGKADQQGKILQTIRDGYKLHGKVIRPAQVSVVQGIKLESVLDAGKRIPIRRGGDTSWMPSRRAPNARVTYF